MNRRGALIGGGAVVLAGAGAAYLGMRGMGSMEEYNASVESTRAALSESPEMRDFIRYATLAPNGHNTQPWRFRIGDGRIEILPDFARRTPVVDPDDHHLFVSLGCAAENLSLAARARGRSGEIEFAPANEGSVNVSLAGAPAASAGSGAGAATDSALFDAIPRRQSTRAEYDGRPVSAADLKTLAAAADLPGVDLVLIADRPQIDRVRDLVVAGNSAQLADAAFLRELKSWLRFSPREAMRAGDGMFSASTGNPSLPAWLGPSLFDLTFKAPAENDKYARQLRSSPGVAVFVSQRADHDHWVRAGRAAQRFALQATALGLEYSFVNQPVEVASLRPDLAALAGTPGRRPDLVIRFGYGPTLPFSARRPVEATLA
jgi:nitroreductase